MNAKVYRWIICFACMLALFCTGGLLVTGFNVYTPYLISEGGLTNPQVSAVLMIRNLITLLSMFVVVPVIRRLDLRLTLTSAILVAAASFLLFSAARGFAAFCAAMALAGLAYGLGGMVSVSVLIRRWFDEHDGLALGLCAAGTGLSAVIGAPIITDMVERHSMRHAMRMEAWFLLMAAALMFALLRNYPSAEKREAVRRERRAKVANRGRGRVFDLDRRMELLLVLGVLLSGMSYNASPYLTVLFREKGFDSVTVGWLTSFMGLALCAGKVIYGEAVDRLGRVRAGNLFHACFVAAIALCALCLYGNRTMAFAAMLLLGVGFPMLSVGLSELAAGTAHEEYYADAVKQLQIVYMIGSVAFGMVPGTLAELAGSYIPVYAILAFLALAAAVLQQGVLARGRGQK